MANHDQDWSSLGPVEIGQRLASLGLYLNRPEPTLICQLCKYSLQPSGEGVSKHLGNKHNVALSLRKGLNAFVESLKFPDPNTLDLRDEGSVPHPHLAIQRGIACGRCSFRTTNSDIMRRHIRDQHPRKHLDALYSWIQDCLGESVYLQS